MHDLGFINIVNEGENDNKNSKKSKPIQMMR